MSYDVLCRAMYVSSTLYERQAASDSDRFASVGTPDGRRGREGVAVATDDEELWAPFLAFRAEDRRAARLRRHVDEDMKRGGRHVPRRAAALSRDEIVR